MRVTNIETERGTRLAVRHDGDWVVVEGPDAPGSVDDLVRGGVTAWRLVEELAAASGRNVNGDTRALAVPWPGKIICIGLNYRRHAIEAKLTLTETPLIFAKFGNTLVASGQPVYLPSTAQQYDYEAELGVVIGRRAVRVSEEEALDFVWGYCNCNDLTARELQARTSQYVLGKTLDGFLPVGPELVSADEVGDPQKLTIRTWVNGELRQDSNTSDMVFGVAAIVSYISQYIPLEVGDFIATGTPSGVILGMNPQVWLKAGDTVDVEVEGLGRLTSPLKAADW
jgi:2-keto-4-pentenoate hydratase/2-oxohepta-3-ene-1,7-dioic acid hydratase in catechol pathway